MRLKTAFAIVCLFGINVLPSSSHTDQDDGIRAAPKTDLRRQTIHLDEKTQQLAGIETQVVKPAEYQAEFIAYGNALDILPLLNLRHRYQQTLAEHASAQARYWNSAQNDKRQQQLYHLGIASQRSLQGHHSQLRVDKASTEFAQMQSQSVRNEALLLWGQRLTDWALANTPQQLEPFLSGRQTLLKITLPADRHLADEIRIIQVEASSQRSNAVPAYLVAPAPQVNNIVQGESYFFSVTNSGIKPGMRVAVWIPEQGKQRSGAVIPESALVWHLEQSFVYVKTGAQTFSRRNIDRPASTAGGYFVGSGLHSGEQLVTKGGQLLLSEEFRMQIPDEDDD